MLLSTNRALNDVIVALATPPGQGALAVVRLSGEGCWEIVHQILSKSPKEIRPRFVYHSWLKVPGDDDWLDEALVTFFKGPQSYTGEDMAEISCHGGIQVPQRLIEAICDLGARIAEPGEFTMRAFLNGKMDLVQAQAVQKIIHARSREQAEISLMTLKGCFSNELNSAESLLLRILAHIEADIDFSTENLSIADRQTILDWIQSLKTSANFWVSTSERNRWLQKGLKILLLGPPNAGKSSLLNNLVGEKRAIVSPIPGTTRDLIESQIFIDGVMIQIFDSAGITESHDPLETLGQNLAKQMLEKVDLVFFVWKPGLDFHTFENLLGGRWNQVVGVVTHYGEDGQHFMPEREETLPFPPNVLDILRISNLDTQKARETIFEFIRKFLGTHERHQLKFMTHEKQLRWLKRFQQVLIQAEREWKEGVGSEIVSLSLREALNALHRVLGKHFDDQILDEIFSEFCIGK